MTHAKAQSVRVYGTLGNSTKSGVTRGQGGMGRRWEMMGLGQVRQSLACCAEVMRLHTEGDG